MNYIWKPSPSLVENSILNNFTKYLSLNFNKDFKKLWLWSVQNPEIFGLNFGIFQK